MGAQSPSLPVPRLAKHQTALGRQLVNWLVMALLAFNIIYSGLVLLLLTPDPGFVASLGCSGRYLPSDACYWLRGLPTPGSTGASALILPVDTPQAAAGLLFGLFMLVLLVASGIAFARAARWRNWAAGLALLLAVAGWSLWGAIPLSFTAVGQLLALLFVAGIIVFNAIGIYSLGAGRPWARSYLVLVGAYAVLVGAIWVAHPVALFQVVLGVLLILLLLERQGRQLPSLRSRITSWTVIPLLLITALIATHRAFIAPAEGIAAFTLNWQTISQRTLEHTRIVLMASLIAIATAVPLGILITRDHKFALRTRRLLRAVTPVLFIALGYLLPGLLVWWAQEPSFLEERGLLRALSLPLLGGLLVGAAIHWGVRRRVRQRRDWGTADSWRSLAPLAINVANVGQTVPSLAVLGLSMTFLGIGFLPAIVALWVRALLPILQNTVAGILAVDTDIIEAAYGMGMTRRQVLFRIELPLAMAVMFAGIRTAVVFNVAVGALAFYIGAGGLGHLIAIGIGLSNAQILVTGGILTALMAIAADFVMGHIQERLVPPSI